MFRSRFGSFFGSFFRIFQTIFRAELEHFRVQFRSAGVTSKGIFATRACASLNAPTRCLPTLATRPRHASVLRTRVSIRARARASAFKMRVFAHLPSGSKLLFFIYLKDLNGSGSGTVIVNSACRQW